MKLLSVIVPVFNEANTIRGILEKINSLNLDKEIIVVDDSSTDGTDKILREIKYDNFKVIHHTSNRGKGAACLTGLVNASAEFVVIQDADLEYDPGDYLKLLEPLKEAKADLVLGARFSAGHQGLFIHRLGNRFLTGLLNLLFSSKLNDYATCYKLARREVWHGLNLKANGFDIDVEIVCNALKKGFRLLEVPVSYHPRTYREGKKIRWLDGLWAIYYMFKYRFSGA
ncbi:MAG: glycosyltransferase family 2 protein [Candidatus Omnitrophica bacterium]|nr:glycosyltransferase family 2 protein [Candidatus Omnitrophota bacterium]